VGGGLLHLAIVEDGEGNPIDGLGARDGHLGLLAQPTVDEVRLPLGTVEQPPEPFDPGRCVGASGEQFAQLREHQAQFSVALAHQRDQGGGEGLDQADVNARVEFFEERPEELVEARGHLPAQTFCLW